MKNDTKKICSYMIMFCWLLAGIMVLMPNTGTSQIPVPWGNGINTGNNATVIVPTTATISINGRAPQQGDAFGYFYTTTSGIQSAGYAIWQDSQTNTFATIWGDNDQTLIKDGFTVGETLTLLVWDAVAGVERVATASYSQGPNVYQVNGYSVLNNVTATAQRAASSLHITGGDNQTLTAGGAVAPLTIQFRDQLGIAYPTTGTVTLTATLGGTTATFTQVVNNASQVVFSGFSLSTAGTWTLGFSMNGLTSTSGSLTINPTISVPWIAPLNTGNNATMIIPANANMSVNGRGILPGDALGVFYRAADNTLVPAGFTIWNGQNTFITIWGDNDQTPMKDGFAVGEQLQMLVWDGQTGGERITTYTLSQGPTTYQVNGYSVVSTATATQLRAASALTFSAGNNQNIVAGGTLQPIIISVTDQLASAFPTSGTMSLTLNNGAASVMFQNILNNVTSATFTGITLQTSGTWSVTATVNGVGSTAGSITVAPIANIPQLTVSPTAVAFGSVTIGNTTTGMVSVTFANLTSDVSLQVTAGFELSTNGSTFIGNGIISSTASQPVQVTIRFMPTVTGATVGTLSLLTNGTNASVALSGTGVALPPPPPAPVISISPSNIILTTSANGVTTGTFAIMYSNSTTAITASVDAISDAGFSLSTNGTSFTNLVQIPTVAGENQSAILFIRYNSDIAAQRDGAAIVNISMGSATTTATADGVRIRPTRLALATVQTTSGNGTATYQFTVTSVNTSAQSIPVTIATVVQINGNFFNESVLAQPLLTTATIPINGTSAQMTLVYSTTGNAQNPTVQATAISGMTLAATDATVSVPVFTPPPVPMLVATPTALSFGSVTVGSVSTATFQVTFANLSAPISLTAPTGFTLSTTGTAPFTTTAQLSQGLSSPRTITVQFAPTVVGTSSGNIQLASGVSSSATVAVSGSGIQPPATAVTFFTENMGTPSGTVAISSNTFQNGAPIGFSGTGDVRNTTPSTGYTGASGNGNVFLTNTVGRDFVISGINTNGYSNIVLSYGQHKNNTGANGNEVVVEFSTDGGSTYTSLTFPNRTDGSVWARLTANATTAIPQTSDLRLRFRQTSSAVQFRIDDVQLSGTVSTDPAISVAPTTIAFGNLVVGGTTTSSVTLTYANLTSGIQAQAPVGFLISTGGTFSQSLTLAATTGSIQVQVRFAPSFEGTTSGNISFSSGVATTASVAVSGTGTAIPVASSLVFTGGMPQTVGQGATLANITVQIRNQFGDAFSTTGVMTLTLTTTAGTVIATQNVSAATQAVFSGIVLNTVATWTATASFNSPNVQNTVGTITIIPPPPAVSASPITLSFGTWEIGQTTTLSYQLNFSNLTAPINLAVPTGFTLSTDGTNFSTTAQVNIGATSPVSVFVRFTATTTGSFSGNISNTTASTSATVAVSATAVVPAGLLVINAANTPIVQTFDGMGTGTVTAAGGDLNAFSPTLNGWYSGTASLAADNGNSTSGAEFNYGLTSNSDRTIGGLQTNSFKPVYGARVRNNIGSAITTLLVQYTGKTWRVGVTSRPDTLLFEYSTNATSLNSGTWTNVQALAYANVGQATIGGGSLRHSALIEHAIQGLNIPAGTTFWLRWNDVNISGTDDGMGVDDVTISANPVLVPRISATPTTLSFATTTTGLVTAAQQVSLSFAHLTENITVTPPSGFELSTTGTAPFTASALVLSSTATSPATVWVRFAPTVVQSFSAQVSIVSGSTNATVQVSGNGIAPPPPTLTVSPTSLNFGSIVQNTVATQTVNLTATNFVTFPATVNVSMPLGYVFSTNGTTFAQNGVIIVTTNGNTSVSIRFAPLAVGTTFGVVTFNATVSSASVSVTGSATEVPRASALVFTAGVPQSRIAGVTLSNISVQVRDQFGNVISTSGTVSLTLTTGATSVQQVVNVSSANSATFSGIVLNTVATWTLSAQMAGLTSTNGTVEITPIPPSITVAPSSLTFGNTEIGETPTQAYVVSFANLTGDVTISAPNGYTIATNATTFVTSAVLSSTATSPITITVRFTPTTATAFSGGISHITNGSSATVAVSGTGVIPPGIINLGTNNTPYNQNFNALGTSNVTASGGDLNQFNNRLTGWYSINSSITAGNGSSNSGAMYHFGLTGDTNRTFGGLLTGSFSPIYGARLRSNATSIAQLFITYTGNTWRVGTASRPDRIEFEYSTNATALNNGTWTAVPELHYQNPGQAATGSGSIQHTTTLSHTITGLNIAPNSIFWIRWRDTDATSSDDGMGIDDVLIVPNPVFNPVITVQPNSVTFGTIIVNTTTSAQVQVNFANVTTAITIAAPAGYQVSTDGNFATFATISSTATSPAVVSVRAVPTVLGNSSDVIVISGSGTTATLAVSANVVPQPTLTVAPTALSVGTLFVGTTSSATFVVLASNLLSNVTITAPTGYVVSSGGAFGTTAVIAASASVVQPVTVEFRPVTAGTFNGVISLSSIATSASVAVSGTAIPRPALTVAPTELNFSGVIINNVSTATFQLNATNLLSDLVITAPAGFRLANGGAFSTMLTIPTTSNTIQTVTVEFLPSIPQPFAGVITLQTAETSATVAVSGQGLAQPQLSLAPTALNMGQIFVNTTTTAQITLLANNILSPITLTASNGFRISTGGTFASSATISGVTSASQVINIQFAPATTGVLNGTVQVQTLGTSATLQLSGSAIEFPLVQVQPAIVNFGNVKITRTATSVVTMAFAHVTEPIIIQMPQQFQVAIGGGNYAPMLTLPATTASPVVLQVRFAPTVIGNTSASMSITAGATNASVLLQGNGLAQPQASQLVLLNGLPQTRLAGELLQPITIGILDQYGEFIASTLSGTARFERTPTDIVLAPWNAVNATVATVSGVALNHFGVWNTSFTSGTLLPTSSTVTVIAPEILSSTTAYNFGFAQAGDVVPAFGVQVTFANLAMPLSLVAQGANGTDFQISTISAVSGFSSGVQLLTGLSTSGTRTIWVRWQPSGLSGNRNASFVVSAGGTSATVHLSATVVNTILAAWNFEASSLVTSGGLPQNSTATISRQNGNSTAITFQSANGGVVANNSGWFGGSGLASWQTSISTARFRNIRVSSKQRSSATGPRDFILQYSLDGTTWTTIGSPITLSDDFVSGVVSGVALPVICDNQPSVRLRWLMNSDFRVNGTSPVTTGFSQIDDIVIDGEPIQPVAVSTVVLGGLPQSVPALQPLMPVTIGILDQFNEPISTSATVELVFSNGVTTIVTTNTLIAQQQTIFTGLSLPTIGLWNVEARSLGLTSTFGTVTTTRIPGSITIVGGNNQTVLPGQTLLPLNVEIRDQLNNLFATNGNVTVQLTLGANIITLQQPFTTAFVAVPLPILTTSGTWNIAASSFGFTTTGTITILPAPVPTSVRLLSGLPQRLPSLQQPSPIIVALFDQYGSSIVATGLTVSATFAQGATVLSTNTFAIGTIATISAPVLPTNGMWNVTITAAGITSTTGTIETFGVPSRLLLTSGIPQQVAIGSSSLPITIGAFDQTNTPFVTSGTVAVNLTFGTTVIATTAIFSSSTVAVVNIPNLFEQGLWTLTASLPPYTSTTGTIQVVYPVPVANSVNPTSAFNLAQPLDIIITGSAFVPVSVIEFAGVTLATTFVSSTELRATVSASLRTTIGLRPIRVVTPAPGGGISSIVNIEILPASVIAPISTSFESNNVWTVISGAQGISEQTGATDTPANQRIRTGVRSWQVQNTSATLDLSTILLNNQRDHVIRVRVASLSANSATDGADASDYVRLFVALNGASLPENQETTATLALNGNNNARWGFDATRIVRTFAGTNLVVQAPAGGTSTDNFSVLEVLIPAGNTSANLRLIAENNSVNEVWAIDDIEVTPLQIGSLNIAANQQQTVVEGNQPAPLTVQIRDQFAMPYAVSTTLSVVLTNINTGQTLTTSAQVVQATSAQVQLPVLFAAGTWNAVVQLSGTPITTTAVVKVLESQQLSLRGGWNFVSLREQPTNASIATVLAGFQDVLAAQSITGQWYFPALGIFDLATWNSERAYRVYVNRPPSNVQTASIVGERRFATEQITLQPGWNGVAYWRTDSVRPEAIFASHPGIVVVKDQFGNFYSPLPALGFTFPPDSTMRPGRGYEIFAIGQTSFAYQTGSGREVELSLLQAPSQSKAYASTQQGTSARTATVVVLVPQATQDDEVVAYNAVGEQVARATVTGGKALLTFFGMDEWNLGGGLSEGEPISLRLLTPSGESRLEINSVKDILADKILAQLAYRTNAVIAVQAEASNRQAKVYPNPAVNQVTVQFETERGVQYQFTITDALGRVVATEVLQAAGNGTTEHTMNVRELPAGAYTITVRGGERSSVFTVVIVR